MSQRQDPPFQCKNPAFVPDKRGAGWYTTNVVGFAGFHESVSLESSQIAHKLLTRNLRDFLNIYYRYRIYISDDGILILSVRQENVNQISDKLFNFRLQAPKPKHFEYNTIAIENAPYYRNLMEEFVDMIHNFNLKTDFLPTAKSKEDNAKYNFLADLINCNKERISLEYKTIPDKDKFIKTIIRSVVNNSCDCKPDCMWRCYENVWVFYDMMERLGERSEQQKKDDFGPLFMMTKEEFDARRTGDAKKEYLDAVDEVVRKYKYTSFADREVIDETNDNTLIHNIDVANNRGLWLSHSRTYADWKAEPVKESKPKQDVHEQSRMDLLEKILKAVGDKHREEMQTKEEKVDTKSNEACSSADSK